MIFGFFVKMADHSCIYCMVIPTDPARSLLREYLHISFSRSKHCFLSLLVEQFALPFSDEPLWQYEMHSYLEHSRDNTVVRVYKVVVSEDV